MEAQPDLVLKCALLLALALGAACAPLLSLPLAKEDATVIVRCSDSKDSHQLIIVLLDHTNSMSEEERQKKRSLQKIAEIEVDSNCHFTVRAPKTPMELSTQP